MALINLSGATRSVTKLGNAIVMTVRPIANIIEMASESSNAWAVDHASNVRAKTDRQNQVREVNNSDLLRKALATAAQTTIDTNVYERGVEIALSVDKLKDQILESRCKSILGLTPEQLQHLATKDNVTDADILRIAKVGTTADVTADDTVKPLDINKFKLRATA